MKKKNSHWLIEKFGPNEEHHHRIKKYLVNKKTKFQKVSIAQTYSFGKCLILDGEMQSAQNDEFIYHEALVHPSFIIHRCPKKVLLFGGGEGATLREILKHNTVKKVSMIDIDEEVINFCRIFLPEWHQGSFDNKRVEIIYTDAADYILRSPDKHDIIMSDLPCPIKGGPAWKLYTLEFYRLVKKRLSTNGIFVLQAGSGSLPQIRLHAALYNTLKKVFRFVFPYQEFIPSFDVPWAFILCSDFYNPCEMRANVINNRIKTRINGNLKFYDGTTHEALFRIPKYLRTLYKEGKEIITKNHPVFFFK